MSELYAVLLVRLQVTSINGGIVMSEFFDNVRKMGLGYALDCAYADARYHYQVNRFYRESARIMRYLPDETEGEQEISGKGPLTSAISCIAVTKKKTRPGSC